MAERLEGPFDFDTFTVSSRSPDAAIEMLEESSLCRLFVIVVVVVVVICVCGRLKWCC